MKKFIALFAFLVSATASSQIQFEKGYFVTNTGEKVECLIKNSDWIYNPDSFDYKLSEDAEIKTAELAEIQEFKVDEFYFIKKSAEIEMSSEKTSELSTERKPNFSTKDVFLRLLIDGEIDFYEYVSRNKANFFFSQNGEQVEPLIQKKYQVNGKINENVRYRQQLASDLKCNDRNFDVSAIDYNRRDLMGYIQNLNKCLGSDSEIFFNRDKNSKLVLYPVVGIGYGNMEVNRGLGAEGTSLSGLEYSVGLELEYIFNFNKYKWSTAIELTYRGFQDEQSIENAGYQSDLKVQYNSVSTFLALRHYFYLSEKSKLFAHVGPIVDVPVGSEILYANTGRAIDPVLNDLNTNFGLGIGIGYAVADKLRLGIDYTSKNVAGEKFVEANYDLDWKSSYSSFSLKLEYAIF
ncbi:hypothetical protein [Christiangramia sp. SM2212]|uniref:Outer membrane protein beta-barrel domain-containing protein n=1 Tax=Christiangramia sediminicola TaxID=3073267 RepID=A0ABU1ETQ8_9FLAO|nr:hypothetical protein [Christiangramia sp. SM2212]MDR5591781.1 hypothetical protein [Christiangramia sp. SM2212]